ncbi:TRAP transporter substrate-binding protein [Limibacillus halophilus]|uniref:TRAP-type mannitol/chloroaromatic compound transport system substrate-binding protein n=1 Tax=Limibacillus halophilus TaxID=1579333 RepID=A0A839SY91_9PROT|nr:TRAP transporter substrate-binding protein [Limibacillus halophilus]MBB3065995.1 TRAP-type mannitol/chloroaromatic compound transport system substrate-binding protein [Limibacillus halophilus]
MKKSQLGRRTFIASSAGLVGAGAAATFASPAISQNRRKWRMVTTWPKNLPGLGTGAQHFADQVTRATGGRLTIELFASGEIVPAFESIDAVGAGNIEMGHGAPYYWKGKAPATQLVSNFPMGLTAQEYNAWYHFGGGRDLCDELYRSALGCKFLPCGNTGIQHPGWSRKEVNSLDDIKGLKMRMPGLGGEVMSRLGATVVNLPGSEVPGALASGAIDWAEWNNPYGEASMGFYRYAKYYYTPGWHEPGTVLELFVNAEKWDSLEDELKAIVENCAYATNQVMLAEFQARSGPVLDSFVNDHGTIVKELSDDIMREIGKVSGEAMQDLANSDPMAMKIFKSMIEFRGHQIRYTNVAEGSFIKARALEYPFPS